MPSGQSQDSGSGIAIDFIDPLFAVVISISFVEVMKRPWFEPGSGSFQVSFAFDITSLGLGYLTVVLSWVGYHLSIRSKPILVETLPGFFRFILDVILLACYWLLLVKFENFLFVLLMLLVVNLVFVFWDQLKWREYARTDTVETRRRRGVTMFWAILFTALFLFYWGLGFSSDSLTVADWVFVALAYIATILYRLHKGHLYPGSRLDLLAFHTPGKEAMQ